MATLHLTDEQVMEPVKQLPPKQERMLFSHLLRRRQQEWEEGWANRGPLAAGDEDGAGW